MLSKIGEINTVGEYKAENLGQEEGNDDDKTHFNCADGCHHFAKSTTEETSTFLLCPVSVCVCQVFAI